MGTTVLSDTWTLEAEMGISDEHWKNSIEIKDTTEGVIAPPPPDASIVDAWRDFLLAIHYPDTTLIQLTLRETLQVVGTPDPGEHFPLWQVAVGSAGTGNTTFGGAHNANYLPKDAALYMRKNTSGGRSGKNFFRNILTEVDVGSTLSGEWGFTEGSGHYTNAAFNGVVAAELADFFGSGEDADTWRFAVAHLLLLKTGDVRAAYSTLVTSVTPVRPTWNRSRR